MKMTPEKIAEAEAWVEKNGLTPQPCGATIRDFCAAMGISDDTYRRWRENAEFADALNRAREKFRVATVRNVENALIRAAQGVDFTRIKEEAKAEKVVEYDKDTGKKIRESTGQLKTIKATKETIYYPPNVEAAKFVLSNLSPEDWKIKREATIQTPGGLVLNVTASERGKANIEQIIAGK